MPKDTSGSTPNPVDAKRPVRLRNGSMYPFAEVDALWRTLCMTQSNYPALFHNLLQLASGQSIPLDTQRKLRSERFLNAEGKLQPIVRDTLEASVVYAANGEGLILQDPVEVDSPAIYDFLSASEEQRIDSLRRLNKRLSRGKSTGEGEKGRER
jgi:hypothetical protein